MIGVLVVTHGKLAQGFQDSVNLIMGEQPQFDTVGLFEGNDFDDFKKSIYDKVSSLDSGEGVAVLVDLFGASPYNATAANISKLKEEGHEIRLITGVNLPMLIESLSQRTTNQDLDGFYKTALTSGKDGIKELMTELERK
ncbi:PTS sugar transporter subunit IIA [Lactiplantibacillus garii]|uniref:PTS sugar transporter subunit IIA n=1 Tax=Lactiplantibacillus garii TaxID=2306423 RepID=A0A426D4K1_9LACO|nr:PTS sugar transporter subunit IIA [Lactiplantibacillus garii]RRK09511.1 PTS sugar transporter subunit IIA [Lactiplantibacillus garii]